MLGLLLLSGGRAWAQDEVPEGWSFGGWEFFEINHNFKNTPIFGSFYFEHDNLQYRYFDCWYTRTTLGVKVLPWLKADVAYDFLMDASKALTHKLLLDLKGTLTRGPLSVSIRERYVHSWTPSKGTQGNVLRSLLKVQYAIPGTHWKPYLAIEVFTWDTWKRTRHYVACTYDVTSWMELEAYYFYYTLNGKPAQHIIGVGVNFYL